MLRLVGSLLSLLGMGMLPFARTGSWNAGAAPPARPNKKLLREGERLAREICVSCHPHTPPDALPRGSWRAEIGKMQLLKEGKPEPSPGEMAPPVALDPAHAKILAWYEAQAPVTLPTPAPWPAVSDRPLRFARRSLSFPDAASPQPAVANVRLADLEGDARPEVVVSDMRHGVVLVGRPYEAEAALRILAPVPHPVHVEVLDLDDDGQSDLVIADLGAFYPADHTKGAVVFLKGLPGGRFAQFTLAGFPRVADVQAGDFDADGRKDLLVAAFGWRRVGEIGLLWNRSESPEQPSFDRRKVDARPGAIHAVPADLNADGLLDFVALIAQEHEKVVAFLNEGKGKGFRPETLYAAPHPNWGSSGLQLVDFDRDGDLDALVTNGDMFDDRLVKPYHGIQWLENEGRFPWTARPLAPLAAVHRALATDLDGDGDLDVVASAFTGGIALAETDLPSLVWLEQTRPGRFERHTLEVGRADHATLDVGDVDGDGDTDLVVGNFVIDQNTESFVEVFENLGAGGKATPENGGGS